MKVRALAVIFLTLFLTPAFSDIETGLAAFTKKDFSTAIKEWQAMADKGDSQAKLHLGLLYAYGKKEFKDFKKAEDLITQAANGGADLNKANTIGKVALDWAMERENIPLIELLLKSKADVNSVDSSQRTVLYRAVDKDKIAVIQLLIKNGADLNKPDKNGILPIHVASKGYNDNKACAMGEILLANGAKVDGKDRKGNTPLHLAAQNGNILFIELIVNKGAKINSQDEKGLTPLLNLLDHQLENSSLKTVEKLLEKGADLNLKSKKGQNALHLLAGNCDNENALPILNLLLEKGAKLEERDKDERTPLQIALKCSSKGVLQKNFVASLLEKGTIANPVEISDEPPIHLALDPEAAENTIALFELLIAKGADINSVNKAGQTVLHLLMYSPGKDGSFKIADFLLNRGSNPNSVDQKGECPLHYLADTSKNGTARMGEILLANKGNPNIQDERKQTPLLIAARKGNLELVKILLANGADLGLTDKYGHTAREEAESNGHNEIVLLVRNGSPGLALPNVPAHPITKDEQEKLATELWQYLIKVNNNDHDLIEKALLLVVDHCPESGKAPEALWKLSNLYLNALDKPDHSKATTVLEKLDQKYPDSMRINPLTGTKEALNPVKKRLGYLYEELNNTEKIMEIYGPIFAQADQLADSERIGYGIPLGKAYEKKGLTQRAVEIYELVVKTENDSGAPATKFAQERLSELKKGK